MTQNFNVLSIIFSTIIILWGCKSAISKSLTKEEAIMRGRQRFDGYDNAKDYEYEIRTGHKRHDDDKMKRQNGCMCVDHFYDPHCGSDSKTYDNGCYFLCGQTRNPGLTLANWGPCGDYTNSRADRENYLESNDFDYDDEMQD